MSARFGDYPLIQTPLLQAQRRVIPYVRPLRKFGNLTTTGTSWQVVWPQGGTYPFQTAAVALEAVSSQAADGVGGAGCRVLHVYGLADDFTEQDEEVALDGLTPVALANTYRRVQRVHVEDAGTYNPGAGLASNVGNITVRVPGPGATLAYLRAGEGQTRQCVYTVPLGKTLYLKQVRLFGESRRDHEFRLVLRKDASVTSAPYSAVRSIGNWDGIAGENDLSLFWDRFPALTDVWIEHKTSVFGGEAGAEFSGLLLTEDNAVHDDELT